MGGWGGCRSFYEGVFGASISLDSVPLSLLWRTLHMLPTNFPHAPQDLGILGNDLERKCEKAGKNGRRKSYFLP